MKYLFAVTVVAGGRNYRNNVIASDDQEARAKGIAEAEKQAQVKMDRVHSVVEVSEINVP